MERRDSVKRFALGAMGAMMGRTPREAAAAETYAQAARALPPLKITKVKAIPVFDPGSENNSILKVPGLELIVVKVETSEPGLYGLGCATFRQRAWSVISAINDYLDPFCRGKDIDNIEDMWQTMYVSSYWRNGPVLNNAMSGVDQALWDIKGKRANMPVYQLLGGKCRFAVDCYAHAGAGPFTSMDEVGTVVDEVHAFMERGFRHVRIQFGGYGASELTGPPDFAAAGFGIPQDNCVDTGLYRTATLKVFEEVRKACGDEIELLHDIHERVTPIDAMNLMKDLEQFRPFFIEDPFSPEDNGYFRMHRERSSVPIAMGELYNNPHEWVSLITGRLIDYIRIHISQIGGITPAMKVARLGEWFNVRTAWHGPGDVSPVGHAANAHIDMAIWNFGIQESVTFSNAIQEVFPGCPVMKNGYMHINDRPGLGVDIDEKAAAKLPIPREYNYHWTQVRRRDGTAVRP